MATGDADRDVEQFVSVFRAAALQAGAVARRLQGEVRASSKVGEGSPEAQALSAADLATQDVLLLRLAEVFPYAAMDAEEETESTARFAAPGPETPLIVVDPIDGSLNYLRGSRDYAVMGSLLRGGRYLASVIHYPAWGETYWATCGGGCFREGPDGRTERVRVRSALSTVLVLPRTTESLRARVAALGYQLETSRCSAVDAAAPVTGRGAAALNLASPDRRRAIGFLLTIEAGGCVVVEHGAWNGEDPEAAARSPGRHVVAHSLGLARELLGAARQDAVEGRSGR